MNRPVAVTSAYDLPENYQIPDHMARDLRRADNFIQMSVLSAAAALAAAPGRDLPPENVGVYIGTAYGPLETNFESLGSLIDDGEGQISPTLFSHSVYNAAAGYVARLLDIRGPALTITNYGWPLLIAMEEARTAVAVGRIERGIVIGVETYSELLADAYRRSYGTDTVPWYRNSVAWILDPAEQVDCSLCRLKTIGLVEAECDPADFLTRNGERWSGPGLQEGGAPQPMAYAGAITGAVAAFPGAYTGKISWQITAPFGRAEIVMEI
ncbi:MAG: hypothetical protein KKG47_07025 [Proteobacteria bacterium]|nr:hypothetical protein [Pseudomonadota bacterium]MBU1739158.1 hypothetical protein [Pseudomonadota bacterium]